MGDETKFQPDSRILKIEYRNYDLIARFWKDEYRGRIWKNNEKIADYAGNDLDSIVENLKKIVDKKILEKARQQGDKPYSENEFTAAFKAIYPKIKDGQKAMLSAHSHAPFVTLSLEKLRLAGDYSTLELVLEGYKAVSIHLMDELASMEERTEEKVLGFILNMVPELNSYNKNTNFSLKDSVASAYKKVLTVF